MSGKQHGRKQSQTGKPKKHSRPAGPKGRQGGKEGRQRSSHSSSAKELIGTVQANEKGFGFFIPEDGSPDAFLPPHQMKDILNGDTIKARVSKDSYKVGKFI